MGEGANPSKRFYDFEKINKNRQIENCKNCKYSELNSFKNYSKSYICIKNNFSLENIDNTVCNYFEEGDISKIKRECGFRRIK